MNINAKIKKITVKEGIGKKTGKPWKKFGFLIAGKKGEDVWIGAWDHPLVRKLGEGQMLNGEVEVSEYDGKPQYTYKPPRLEELILESLKRIETKLGVSRPSDALPAAPKEEPVDEPEDFEGPESDVPF